MEQVLIGLGILLVLPFYFLVWLWGATLIKRLFDKEWKKAKGLLAGYEQLTPEQRMSLEIHRDEPTTPTQAQPKDDGKSQWLGSPTPQVEIRSQNERVFQEGVVHPIPGGQWESHEEASKSPDTTITDPEALKPKP